MRGAAHHEGGGGGASVGVGKEEDVCWGRYAGEGLIGEGDAGRRELKRGGCVCRGEGIQGAGLRVKERKRGVMLGEGRLLRVGAGKGGGGRVKIGVGGEYMEWVQGKTGEGRGGY